MKKVFLLFIAACLSVVVSAQKVYFIYLQTEDQSPFYVRMGDKIYSSAASGYLILPSLTDSTYYLSLGFAKTGEIEAKFSVAINQNDRGFLIKKFDDGPALFDFEEMSLVKSDAAAKDNTVYTTKTDNFSNLLSKAADDPSLVKVPVPKKEEPVPVKKEEIIAKKEEPKPVEKPAAETTSAASSDTAIAVKNSQEESTAQTEVKPVDEPKADTIAALQNTATETAVTQPVKKEETTVQETPYRPSVISRGAESSTTEGFGLVFYDKHGEHTDTIRILIPSPKVKLMAEPEAKASSDFMLTKEKVDSVVEAKKKAVENAANEKNAAETVGNMPLCADMASEKDFLKLRKRMAGEETDEDMIAEAKKEFKDKCFTVEQIKFLGSLFLTSAGRYQFFDAAYQHVSDRKNYALLQAELTDEYYIKRFKALIGE